MTGILMLWNSLTPQFRAVFVGLVFAGGAYTIANIVAFFHRRKGQRAYDSALVWLRVILPPSMDVSVTQVASFIQSLAADKPGRLASWWRGDGPHYRFMVLKEEGKPVSIYFACAENRERTLEHSLQAKYPGAKLQKIDESPLTKLPADGKGSYASLKNTRHSGLVPLKISWSDRDAMPLDSAISALTTAGWGALVVMLSPIGDRHLSAHKHIDGINKKAQGKQDVDVFSPSTWGGNWFSTDKKDQAVQAPGLTEYDKQVIGTLRSKADGASATIARVVSYSHSGGATASILSSLVSMSDGQQGLVAKKLGKADTKRLLAGERVGKTILLGHKELVGLTRLPNNDWGVWGMLDTGLCVPDDLVRNTSGLPIALSDYSSNAGQTITIPWKRVFQHVFIAGQTSGGKGATVQSMLLRLMESMANDVEAGRTPGVGFTYIDPHADDLKKIMAIVPESIRDRVHILRADTDMPVGWNLIKDHQGHGIFEGIIGVLNSAIARTGGVRIDRILRDVAAVLDNDPHATILDMIRAMDPVNTSYRDGILARIKDPMTRQRVESLGKLKPGDIEPITSRLSPFQGEHVRAIIGQSSGINIRRIMDDGDILFVDLKSFGVLADIIGGTLVTQYHLAAQSRANIPETKRRPHLLICDEVHTFETDAMDKILSEDRKFGLSIVLITQYLNRVSRDLLEAVVGNCLNKLYLRLGQADAPFVQKDLAGYRGGETLGTSDITRHKDLHGYLATADTAGEKIVVSAKQVIPAALDYSAFADDKEKKEAFNQALVDKAEVLMQEIEQREGKPRADVQAELDRRWRGGASAIASPPGRPKAGSGGSGQSGSRGIILDDDE